YKPGVATTRPQTAGKPSARWRSLGSRERSSLVITKGTKRLSDDRLALVLGAHRALLDRRERIPLSDRQPVEGFGGNVVETVATLSL
ncbi:hypothetical protein, partial [Natronomonas sp.]|uniref:hypothetical protein n=1 Tax=Natronomonas sp. TaxID=2184060 RepID=UPI002FC3B6A2